MPIADCSQERFSAHPKTEMCFSEFITYWRDVSASVGHHSAREGGWSGPEGEGSGSDATHQKVLYLKDWHFVK